MMGRITGRLKSSKGFTLIELMVVISIIAILVAIALPRFVNARRSANTAKIAADLRIIESAMNMYYVNNNRYPITEPQLSKSELYNGEVKYFASLPEPPRGEFYYAEKIGGEGKIASVSAREYSIFENIDFNDTNVRRAGLVVPQADNDKNQQVLTLEYFVGFSSISNEPPAPYSI